MFLFYGFHGTGVNVAKSLRVSRNNHYRLRGFISDEPDMIGKHTMGCRVYPNDEQLFDRTKEKESGYNHYLSKQGVGFGKFRNAG